MGQARANGATRAKMRPGGVASLLLALCLVVGACSNEGSGTDKATSSAQAKTDTSSTVQAQSLKRPARKHTAAATPKLKRHTVRERQFIPFGSRTVTTSQLKKGVTRLKHRGKKGIRIKVFRVTTRGDAVVSRKLVRVEVERKPVPSVRLRGTRVPHPSAKPRRSCDPNYSGGCVPIASDVDCGGGSGNGPAYVYETVKVVGTDIYGLDADGDGYGCD